MIRKYRVHLNRKVSLQDMGASLSSTEQLTAYYKGRCRIYGKEPKIETLGGYTLMHGRTHIDILGGTVKLHTLGSFQVLYLDKGSIWFLDGKRIDTLSREKIEELMEYHKDLSEEERSIFDKIPLKISD